MISSFNMSAPRHGKLGLVFLLALGTVFSAVAASPSITSITPNPLTYSSTSDTITLNGSNFVSGCTVTLKDITNGGTFAKSVTYVSSSQIKVTANFTNNTATWSAQVTSPTASNTVQFQVKAAVTAPTITSITPNPLTYSSTSDTI
ncbi:MAG: IPT/TIG domain-containing protein, partial [Candidatus Hydrogenedentes bacterium]|nr:IPT/TIG domain-containing protein [Candidatus Hydrogenedentota bacterium]